MLPWLRIRVVLSGIDAKQGIGGRCCVSGNWCWAWAIWARAMGGGPRTFPGGVTKWQWKRMLVKRRQEREQHRLAREKAIYEMRQRAEVLATHPELQQPWEKLVIFPPPGTSTGQQVANLVRRFDKPSQAKDLWTQRDGPQQGTDPSSSCLIAEPANASLLSGQAQHPPSLTRASPSCLDVETSNTEFFYRGIQRPPLRPRPYSARWLTMDTSPLKQKKKKEVSPIGKSMQDYLDAFDTDPLGVAVDIDTGTSKKEVYRDPLGLSVDKREPAKSKASPKKKPGKGGRKNRGR